MKIFDSTISGNIIAFIIIIAVCAAIALVALLIYKWMHPKLKETNEKTEKDYANEELDRILQPIEDAETAKQVDEYKDEEDQ